MFVCLFWTLNMLDASPYFTSLQICLPQSFAIHVALDSIMFTTSVSDEK